MQDSSVKAYHDMNWLQLHLRTQLTVPARNYYYYYYQHEIINGISTSRLYINLVTFQVDLKPFSIY